jgi:hypothetical protein
MSKKKTMQPLSEDQVKSALGLDTRILKYGELRGYETITDLLPNVNDFVIILLEEEQNRGHWVTLMKPKEGYYYFNSYGQKYDDDLSVIPRCIRRILGEDRKEITRLLDGTPCRYNKHKFQADKTQVCGRYCVLACSMICKMGYSPEDFEDFLLDKKKDNSVDQLVAGWVSI